MTVLPALEEGPLGAYDYLASPVYHIGDWHGNAIDAWGVAWVVQSEDGWSGSPSRRVSLSDRAQDDGAYAGASYFGPRVITLSGTADAPSRAAMLAAKRRFSAVLSGQNPEMLIVEEEDLTLQAAVLSTGDNKAKDKGATAFEWSLQLTAPDPRKYELTETVDGTVLPNSADLGGRKYPRIYPLTYGGTGYRGSGRIRLVNNGNYRVPGILRVAGPTDWHTVTHVESGRSLHLTQPLSATDEVVYDLALRQVTLNGTIRNDLLASRGWFVFQPGQNTLLFRGHGDATASLSASFYGAYI
jgi:hypothetical protein